MMHTKLSAVPATRLARLVPASLPTRLWRTWREYARRRATLATLSRLDDRMLADVGLRREDLASLKRQGAWGSSDDAILFLDTARRRSATRTGRF